VKKKDPGENRGLFFGEFPVSTQDNDVRRLRTFGALCNFELYLITFVEHLESISLDGGIMNEHVIPFIPGNESKALLLVKPFHTTFGHYNSPPF
jgi:hypothetical protein